jgi:hypothetical protein
MKPGTHVYRVNPVRLLTLPTVWLVLVIVLLVSFGVSDAPGEPAAGVQFALILTLIFASMFYFMLWQSRLELDEHGITHFQFGYTIHSNWANLERLSMQRGVEGIYLIQPGTDSSLLRSSTRFVQGMSRVIGVGSVIGDAEALAQGRFIALMPFTSHLGGGPLSQDLERWAPHLFVQKAAGNT